MHAPVVQTEPRVKVWRGSRPGFSLPNVLKKFRVAGSEAAISSGVAIVANLMALLRTRVHSGLPKINSLFLMTAPPAKIQTGSL